VPLSVVFLSIPPGTLYLLASASQWLACGVPGQLDQVQAVPPF
jgi:hypothetical protein